MDYAEATILITPSIPEIQKLLDSSDSFQCNYSSHYSQSEDFFIKLKNSIRVPPIPIHHNVQNLTPSSDYIDIIKNILEQLIPDAGAITQGLTYFFDPRDHLRPGFFKLYRIGDKEYIYLVKIDFTFHPSFHTIIEQGTNDTSPLYETRKISIEADFIPLTSIKKEANNQLLLTISQSISETWIGETGRGYFVQGIWLDRELTKFFSKLFIPQNTKIYPYFPFTCKYRAICHSVVLLDPEGRKNFLTLAHNGRLFIQKHISSIEQALHKQEFSESIPEFQDLYEQVPHQWKEKLQNFSMKRYLNDQEMREYQLHYE